MKSALFLAAALFFGAANAQEISRCDQMVPFGYPTTTAKIDATRLCRLSYVVNHDNVRKVPMYAAELLLFSNLKTDNKRVNAFKADPDLPEGKRAELSDYDETFDRGHMVPYEDTKHNSAAALQTFYLSNIAPQNLHMNRGLWRAIENRTRNYSLAYPKGVHVFTGPVFKGRIKKHGTVSIPTSFYKVVIDKNTMQGIAWLAPNAGPKKGDSPDKFIVPISVVEKATKINFTPSLKDGSFKNVVGTQFVPQTGKK